jgi:hypothetical protein
MKIVLVSPPDYTSRPPRTREDPSRPFAELLGRLSVDQGRATAPLPKGADRRSSAPPRTGDALPATAGAGQGANNPPTGAGLAAQSPPGSGVTPADAPPVGAILDIAASASTRAFSFAELGLLGSDRAVSSLAGRANGGPAASATMAISNAASPRGADPTSNLIEGISAISAAGAVALSISPPATAPASGESAPAGAAETPLLVPSATMPGAARALGEPAVFEARAGSSPNPSAAFATWLRLQELRSAAAPSANLSVTVSQDDRAIAVVAGAPSLDAQARITLLRAVTKLSLEFGVRLESLQVNGRRVDRPMGSVGG